MKSTFGGLNTVVRGLYAQQVSLDTVGHNISNTNTDGYSRQGVNLSTTRPESIYTANGENQAGTGVNVLSVTRARDIYIDRQMWKEGASLGYGQAISTTLGKIEELFHEPSDKGVQTTLNNFWKSWQNLATNASDNGMRTVVRQRGVEIVDSIQHASQQLVDMAADTNAVIKIKVDNVNQINSEICSLNKQISVIEAGGTDHANDLRDRRDLLVDQLSKMMDITINEDKYGNYSIQSGNVALVDGLSYQTLDYTTTTDKDFGYPIVSVVKKDSTVPMNFRNGELQGLIESRDSEEFGVKGYLNHLNTVSQFLLTEFNNQHLKGYGTDDTTGNNFFGDTNIYYTNDTTNLTAVQTTYPAMAKVFGKNVTGTTIGVDYDKPAPNNNWINQLKVNPALFTTSPSGLAKIAAKTTPGTASPTKISTVQPSNPNGGALKVTSSNYTGAESQTIVVKVTGINTTTGVITGVSCTVNNATITPTFTSGSPSTLTITIGGSTTDITIDANLKNASNDTYSFTIGQGNASSDNAVKLANHLKTDTFDLLEKSSLDTFYNSMIGTLGVQSQNATRLTDNQTTLVNQIENWRQSVSGVNIDEEMSNMIRFQKGYNAAARVLTSMDEMLDKLINGTGVVGR